MKIESHHPFQISVYDDSLTISAGKVYNFYNPLNFRYVQMNRGGSKLAELPLPLSEDALESEGIKPETLTLSFEPTVNRIVVYLLASFKPPVNWVPSEFFIPMVDESWLLFRMFTVKEDQVSYSLVGETKNSKGDHLKDQTFDMNIFNADIGEEPPIFYEEDPQIFCNAFNLGIVGTVERTEDGWKINQCINADFPITSFFSSRIYDFTDPNSKFYTSNLDTLEEENYVKKGELNDRKFFYLGIPKVDSSHYRGYTKDDYEDKSFNGSRQRSFNLPDISSTEHSSKLGVLFDPS